MVHSQASFIEKSKDTFKDTLLTERERRREERNKLANTSRIQTYDLLIARRAHYRCATTSCLATYFEFGCMVTVAIASAAE